KRLEPDDERIGALSGGHVECRSQIFNLAHIEQVSLKTESACRRFHLEPLTGDRRVAHVEEHRDPRGPWHELAQQLDPLRIYLRYSRAQARDVPAGAGQTRDDALPDRITHAGDDHRDPPGGG